MTKEYRPSQCEGNVKTCPVGRGGCGYRYLKTDTKWQEGGVCPQCGFDRRCDKDRVIGMNVCRVHGAGSVKKGRIGGRPVKNADDLRAKSLPKKLRQGYEQYLQDPRLLELRRDISTLSARNDALMKQIEEQGANQLWPQALEAFKQLRKADRRGNYNDKVKFEQELESILDSGNTEFLRWQEVTSNIELIRRLSATENKRLVDADQMISRRQLMAFMAALANIIDTTVTDAKMKAAIGFGIQRLLSVGETTQQTIDIELEPQKEHISS